MCIVKDNAIEARNISKVIKKYLRYSAIVYDHYWKKILLKSSIPFWYHD